MYNNNQKKFAKKDEETDQEKGDIKKVFNNSAPINFNNLSKSKVEKIQGIHVEGVVVEENEQIFDDCQSSGGKDKNSYKKRIIIMVIILIIFAAGGVVISQLKLSIFEPAVTNGPVNETQTDSTLSQEIGKNNSSTKGNFNINQSTKVIQDMFKTQPKGVKGFIPSELILQNYAESGHLNVLKLIEDKIWETPTQEVTIKKDFEKNGNYYEFAQMNSEGELHGLTRFINGNGFIVEAQYKYGKQNGLKRVVYPGMYFIIWMKNSKKYGYFGDYDHNKFTPKWSIFYEGDTQYQSLEQVLEPEYTQFQLQEELMKPNIQKYFIK